MPRPARRRWLLLACLATGASGCVSTRLLSAVEVRELSERRYDADADEAFDATWLLLERRGFTAVDFDRPAGTFSMRHADGRGYEVEVSASGPQHLVRAVPAGRVSAPAQLEAWDALETDTRGLLEAWRQVPELAFEARRSALSAPGLSLALPRDWEHVELAVNRRRAVAQARKPRTPGLNPTLLVEIDRRRHRNPTLPLARVAAGLALTATARLVFPDEVDAREDEAGAHALARVFDGNVTRELTLHLWSAADDTWTYRVAMACPGEGDAAACEATWRGMLRSLFAPGTRRLPLE